MNIPAHTFRPPNIGVAKPSIFIPRTVLLMEHYQPGLPTSYLGSLAYWMVEPLQAMGRLWAHCWGSTDAPFLRVIENAEVAAWMAIPGNPQDPIEYLRSKGEPYMVLTNIDPQADRDPGGQAWHWWDNLGSPAAPVYTQAMYVHLGRIRATFGDVDASKWALIAAAHELVEGFMALYEDAFKASGKTVATTEIADKFEGPHDTRFVWRGYELPDFELPDGSSCASSDAWRDSPVAGDISFTRG